MEVKLAATLVACILFCIYSRGHAACSLSDLAVTQTRQGGQYLVTVENKCICTQANVKLACPGFNSSIPVLPADTVVADGDNALCTFIGHGPVPTGHAIQFSYTSNTKFSFAPVSSSIMCS